MLSAAVALVSQRLDGRLASVESVADSGLRSVMLAADSRLAQMTATADLRMASVQDELRPVTAQTMALLDRYREVPDQLAWATAEIWDCSGGNARCIENQYVKVADASAALSASIPSIAKSAARSSEAFAEGFPTLLDSSNKVANNVERMTHPSWWDRLISGGIGSLRYFGR